MNHSDSNKRDDPGIASPFSDARAIPTSYKSGSKRKIWIVGGAIFVLALLIALSVSVIGYLNDPYRKLEEFPVSNYFESYQMLAGLKLRSDLRVEADLGWKEGIGRLMAFTPNGEDRQIAIFIPPSLSNVFFKKGQNYTMELEVKDGGLIYASACRKN